MDDNVLCKKPNGDEPAIDPESNNPESLSHIGPDKKINLQLWQLFDDYKSWSCPFGLLCPRRI